MRERAEELGVRVFNKPQSLRDCNEKFFATAFPDCQPPLIVSRRADLLRDFGRVMHDTDHVEFFWMPGARRCQVKRNTRTDEPARPQSKVGYVRDKWIGENLAFGTVCRVGRRFPSLAPKVAKLVMSAAAERDVPPAV